MSKIDTIYKLTRTDLTTYNRFQYVPGEVYRFSGKGGLCGPGFSHAYLSVATALLHNPIHANYRPARLWRAEGLIAAREGEMKVGCTEIVLCEELAMPPITPEQRVAYAIRCAWPGGSVAWKQWAKRWLTGEERGTAEAARTARAAWAAWAAGTAWDAARAAGTAPLIIYADWAITATTPFVWEGMDHV